MKDDRGEQRNGTAVRFRLAASVWSKFNSLQHALYNSLKDCFVNLFAISSRKIPDDLLITITSFKSDNLQANKIVIRVDRGESRSFSV